MVEQLAAAQFRSSEWISQRDGTFGADRHRELKLSLTGKSYRTNANCPFAKSYHFVQLGR